MQDVDYFSILLQFVGGLGLFLYGMHIMAAGLQKSAGSKMKSLLEALTKNKLMGVLVGAGVTGIIQSSSATTVMVVGFVNAGLLNLSQSVGVIMGANIGTTVTSWLISSVEWARMLNPTNLAMVAVAIGSIMVLFVKNFRTKQIGEVLVGLGVLFIGMNMMAAGVKPLSGSPAFEKLFITLGANPLLGILAGTIVTAIIQSSSASVGILQSLALVGLVPWNAAVYVIMGQNIGTCITAILSSIGATRNAKSAAYIHLLFNVIGSIIFSVLAGIYFTLINPVFGNTLITITEISIVHTAFNVANTIILYPFSDVIINLARRMSNANGTEDDESALVHLDDRILEAPSFAIENCLKEIVRMGYMALDNLAMATQALLEKNAEKIEKVLKREKNIDALNNAITQFMVKVCNQDITEEENRTMTALFHTVNDIERVGDHSENIAELADFAIQENANFSNTAIENLNHIINLTYTCFENCIFALEKSNKDYAKKVVEEEDQIDTIEKDYRSSHIKRLANNECNPASGVIFLDCITNLERISDHALNIAQMVLKEKGVKKAAQ